MKYLYISAKLHCFVLQDTEILKVKDREWGNGRYFLSEHFLGIILLYEQSDCIEKRGVKVM